MDLELENKVIIVTGGASGIGEAIVRTLTIEGAIAVIFDLKPKTECEALLEDLNSKHAQGAFFQVDLCDDAELKKAVANVVSKFGRIDGIVNNAGVNDGVGLDGDAVQFTQSLNKNVIQCFNIVHHALPHLQASDSGSIVNIGSKVALTGQGGTSGYAASKGALLGLTREWAVDLAADQIRVNAVIPAEVWTPMYDDWLSTQDDPAARRKEIESTIPLGKRMTESQEIADMTVFLLSPRSSHTTGQIISVDGGYVHLDRAYRG